MGKRIAMPRGNHLSVMASGRGFVLRLLAFVLLLGSASSAYAATFCSTSPLDTTGMWPAPGLVNIVMKSK
jgi:hypothetical protein